MVLQRAIADVDHDVLWYEGYALAQKGQPLPEGANDAITAGHQAAVEAGNLIAA